MTCKNLRLSQSDCYRKLKLENDIWSKGHGLILHLCGVTMLFLEDILGTESGRK